MLLRLAVRLKGVWSESRKFFHGTKRRELESCIKCEAAEHRSERANQTNVEPLTLFNIEEISDKIKRITDALYKLNQCKIELAEFGIHLNENIQTDGEFLQNK
jgi:hypothetical protein